MEAAAKGREIGCGLHACMHAHTHARTHTDFVLPVNVHFSLLCFQSVHKSALTQLSNIFSVFVFVILFPPICWYSFVFITATLNQIS